MVVRNIGKCFVVSSILNDRMKMINLMIICVFSDFVYFFIIKLISGWLSIIKILLIVYSMLYKERDILMFCVYEVIVVDYWE